MLVSQVKMSMTTATFNSSSFWNTTDYVPPIQGGESLTPIIILLVCGLFISILNINCLIVLAKDKKLKEKRFDMLTVCLSFGDAATGLLLSGLSIQYINFELTGNGSPPFCFISLSLITSTVMFSLFQTLWICVERLLATFPTRSNSCRKISVFKMTMGIYLVCVAFVFTIYSFYSNIWSHSCKARIIFGQNRVTTLSIFQPIYLITVLAIIFTYTGVIVRIYKSWRRVHPHFSMANQDRRQSRLQLPTAISTVQSEYFTGDQNTTNAGHLSMQRSVNHGTRNAMNRILKMAITLGFVILVLLLSVMPKVIIGLAVIGDPLNTNLNAALEISDIFLFLNPLLDPFIYVLRIRSFRERLSCTRSSG